MLPLSHAPAQNNIGLLRLLFALMVVGAHGYHLSLSPSLSVLLRFCNSELAVQGFFVLSGFLVTMSHARAHSLRDYAVKRVRRIYPAYACVVLLCALAGLAFSTASLSVYASGMAAYLGANLVFLNFLYPTLPGVFEGHALPAVNGALWTIKIEVMFYLCVPVLAWLFRGRARPWLLISFYIASIAYGLGCAWMAVRSGNPLYTELGRQLPGQLCYFLSGMALYYYFPQFQRHQRALLLAAVLAVLLGIYTPFTLLYPAGLAVLVMSLAFGRYLGNSERYGDLSYGIYVWHFPIIQLLIAQGLYAQSPWLALVSTVGVTVLAAFLSWRLVEKPALRRSSHYVAADTIS